MAENLTFVLLLSTALVFSACWLVMEAMRGRRSREEIYRLRRRIHELEQGRSAPSRTPAAVLSPRPLRSGAAATTSDGGCLVLLERISPALTAEFTIRVDGYAVLQHHPLPSGEPIQVSGKFGDYIITVHAIDRTQAQVGVVLQQRDLQARSAPTS